MNKLTLSRPYAKAIFKLASKDNSLEKWEQELEMYSIISQDKRMLDVIYNKTISNEEKANLLKSCAGEYGSEEGLILLIELAKNKKLDILPEIKVNFDFLCSKENESLIAELISAKKLSEDQKQKINKQLSEHFNCKIDFVYKIDESILDGYIAIINDTVIDNSIRGRLNSVQRIFS